MAKFGNNKEKLSKIEIDKMLYQLCLAIAEMKNANEAAALLRDLLSYQESEMIAKRLKIAELLRGNKTYQEIIDLLGVSAGTIARVHEWMNISGEGYRMAIERMGNKNKADIENIPTNFNSIKKRFPAYYWPEIVLENIIANSNKKQKDKLKSVIKELEKSKEKSDLYRKLKKLVKY